MARVVAIKELPPEDDLAAQIAAAGLPHPVRQFRFVPGRLYRADFAWPDERVICEVDGGTWSGGRHVRGAGFEQDCVKLDHAAVLGYRVVRATTAMVRDGRALSFLTQALEAAKPPRQIVMEAIGIVPLTVDSPEKAG